MKKESDDSSMSSPRKARKFVPKAPPKKVAKTVVPKNETTESKDVTIDEALLMKLRTSKSNGGFTKGAATIERTGNTIPTQVAFGDVESLVARSFPIPSSSKDPSTSTVDKVEKAHVDPWDYTNSDYPITLPLRRPNSGDREILDEEEFGWALDKVAKDEIHQTPAKELGLLERREECQLLFFQLPRSLPLPKRPFAATNSKQSATGAADGPIHGCQLKQLPGGHMGKMLVYKSGKVKLKLGNSVLEVSSGLNCKFAQDVAAINVKKQHCCILGQLSSRAIVTPDIDTMLDSIEKM